MGSNPPWEGNAWSQAEGGRIRRHLGAVARVALATATGFAGVLVAYAWASGNGVTVDVYIEQVGSSADEKYGPLLSSSVQFARPNALNSWVFPGIAALLGPFLFAVAAGRDLRRWRRLSVASLCFVAVVIYAASPMGGAEAPLRIHNHAESSHQIDKSDGALGHRAAFEFLFLREGFGTEDLARFALLAILAGAGIVLLILCKPAPVPKHSGVRAWTLLGTSALVVVAVLGWGSGQRMEVRHRLTNHNPETDMHVSYTVANTEPVTDLAFALVLLVVCAVALALATGTTRGSRIYGPFAAFLALAVLVLLPAIGALDVSDPQHGTTADGTTQTRILTYNALQLSGTDVLLALLSPFVSLLLTRFVQTRDWLADTRPSGQDQPSATKTVQFHG